MKNIITSTGIIHAHSPVPWQIVGKPGEKLRIVDNKKKTVARMGFRTVDDNEANALLIEAAPDLLAALDRAVKDLCFLQTCVRISRQKTIEACESAIAKATKSRETF